MTSGPRSASGALASAARVEILHALQTADGPLTIVELADAVGRHANTVREHLDRLVLTRFVERTAEARTTRGRPRILYRAAERVAGATLDERFRTSLRRLFLAGLDVVPVPPGGPASPVQDAGPAQRTAAPGEREQLAALGIHLEDLGFDPDPEPGGRCVHLRRCPFATLARERTELTCSVHLDVIRGVMASAGGPLTAERLVPFVGPEHCLLHLAPITADTAAG